MKIRITKGGKWYSQDSLQKEWVKDDIIEKYACSTINSHRARGFDIQVTPKELRKKIKEEINEPCKYCGCKMEYHPPNNRITENMITTDIINPAYRVLSLDNVQFICHACNQMKSHFPEPEFLRRCINIAFRTGIY